MIYHLSCAELAAEVPADSVDWIITDPPYMAKFAPCWSELAGFAAHALKPGGSLVAMAGHTILPEAFALLGAESSLRFHWILAYDMIKGQSSPMFQRRVFASWKPVLWYKKPGGDEKPPMVIDIVRCGKYSYSDRKFHNWAQIADGILALCQHFHLTPGQIVVDPFVGGGTTAIAALAVGCDFIGADVDAASVETTRQRMLEYQPVML